MPTVEDACLHEIRARFRAQRELADKAIAQVPDDALFKALDDDANSIAVLLKHVGGNLRSRWTEPFTTDGEKPDRDRDGEFEHRPADTRASVLEAWADGWRTLESTLDAMSPSDLLRPVVIRGEPMTGIQALGRSLAHTAQHVGQIVLLARHFTGSAWQTLSIPKRTVPPASPHEA